MSPTDEDPVVINLSNCRYPIVYEAAQELGWRVSEDTLEEDDTWTVWWMDKSSATRRVRKLKDYQRINHYPYMDTIARKHKLTRFMKRMARIFPDEYDFYPQGWELPQEYQAFRQFARTAAQEGKDLTYIAKPNADSCGRGIFLSKVPTAFEHLDYAIVQHYVDNPLCIEGHKFDIRVYLLVVSVHPLILYMYNEGYIYLAVEEYAQPTRANLRNRCVHLANLTLNKGNRNYEPQKGEDFSSGHKRNFAWFRRWLREVHHRNPEQIFAGIEDVLVKTVIAGLPTIEHYYLDVTSNEAKKDGSFTCFEILGFDIMLDEEFRPWLLEVNHSPLYHVVTPLDQIIKFGLISEAFQLLGIDPRRRNRSLERERLLKQWHGQVPRSSNHLKPMSRKRELEAKAWAESQYLKNYVRIYPVEGSEKFDRLLLPRTEQGRFPLSGFATYQPQPQQSRASTESPARMREKVLRAFDRTQRDNEEACLSYLMNAEWSWLWLDVGGTLCPRSFVLFSTSRSE